ncbi:hypothetical protein L6164_002521 [Bauhinia variegata]|uniref:Uncharacterized protein n=1 Tax=Bauhinia variegata TaxID=167791 RepID=A0ACB9Q0L7_BAUVA|nr:hypothetical protein L6164_002521 [Bauhinia variegata]
MTVPKLLILVLIFIPAKFASGNVNVSSALSTNDKQPFWLSDSGEFAFGFHQINNTNLFLLAIWYHTIPEQTIVWNANSDNPAPTGSEVLLTSRGLTLRTPNGDDISIAAQNDTVSYGAMLDTGNFVLAANGNSPYVWESFKNPTDTLLPNQYLESGNKLSSRFSETNYTIGRFELYFNNNGNLLLSPIAWPTQIRYAKYYSTDVSVPSAKLVFNQSLDIYIEDVNGSKTQLTGWDQSSNLDSSVNYYRATLDFNGIFALYEHTKNSNGNQGWSRVEYVPKDICTVITNDMGSGYCGYNSYCTSSTASPPTCECPPGYSFIDPNNQFSGCQPDYYLGCGADVDAGPEELYNITQKSNLNWPLGDYERLNPSSLQECKNSCLYDCFCAAAVFSHETCWKKKFPLSNGRYESGTEVLFKTRLGPLLADLDPSHEEKKDEDYKPVLLGSLIGSLVVNAKFASGNVNVSSTLSTNDKQPFWLSDSGEFAFGFHQINNTNLFLLAIWYHTIPEQTIVWSANAGNPAPTGSEILLTSRGLTLRTPNGDDISIAAQNDTISHGAMLDTGNFVLAANGNSTYVWESFKNPTDTLLPNQYLESGNMLSSRFSETNYTRGRFELYFDNNDHYLGCGADVGAGPEELYNITEQSFLNWPLGDYEKLKPYSLEDCKTSCLYDCFCAVAVFSNETCWKKKFPLANGRQENVGQVLIKTRLGPLQGNLNPSHEEKKDKDYKPVLLGSFEVEGKMNDSDVSRQIQQMIRFIRQEAEEKANEITLSTEEEFNIEKLQLLDAEKKKIRQEYDKKVKQVDVRKKIEYSMQLSAARMKVLQAQDDVVNSMKESARKALLSVSDDNNAYRKLVKDLIVQSLMRLKEASVILRCRECDLKTVESVLEEARKEYANKAKAQAPKITLDDGVFLPPPPKDDNTDTYEAYCSGGVVMASDDGKIVCENTLDARLDVIFRQKLPQIRKRLLVES